MKIVSLFTKKDLSQFWNHIFVKLKKNIKLFPKNLSYSVVTHQANQSFISLSTGHYIRAILSS